MNKKGKIVIISGPSGVGKKTIIEKLMKDANLNLVYSISMTTRKKREGEINGIDYLFVDEPTFIQAIDQKELLEWAEFAGNKYGTPYKQVKNKLNEGKNVLLEIEVQGAMNVKKMLPRDDFISVFILPPSLKELKNRLKNRNADSWFSMWKRLKTAKKEIALQSQYDHVVINDQIDVAVEELRKYIGKNVSF